ncbi:MAG: class I SAM-dependent methyltransferase [Acidobacteria bacterium]|nr:class I SAM-dependent methyltransferase [Acidobacteriota bacterium]
MDVQTIYQRRFADMLAFRRQMWEVLCREFFQQHVPPGATIVEIGAGYCEFINHIRAGRKIAVDLNPDTRTHAGPDVEVITSVTSRIDGLESGLADVVFASNFLEHLSREDILATLREVRRVLKPSGRFLVLQPNIRYCKEDYWQFFDHITPLCERSLTEALETTGFEVVSMRGRFLPFTTHGRLPNSIALLRLYLKLRPAWRIFGQQSFAIAAPRA